MEGVIAKLLQDFEQGKMNRRQLIKSLSVAAAAAAGMAPARAAGKPLEALYVNHISYEVNDYKKVRDFYVDLLGMKVTEDDGKQCRLVFGNNMLIPRNRAGGGPAKVDLSLPKTKSARMVVQPAENRLRDYVSKPLDRPRAGRVVP